MIQTTLFLIFYLSNVFGLHLHRGEIYNLSMDGNLQESTSGGVFYADWESIVNAVRLTDGSCNTTQGNPQAAVFCDSWKSRAEQYLDEQDSICQGGQCASGEGISGPQFWDPATMTPYKPKNVNTKVDLTNGAAVFFNDGDNFAGTFQLNGQGSRYVHLELNKALAYSDECMQMTNNDMSKCLYPDREPGDIVVSLDIHGSGSQVDSIHVSVFTWERCAEAVNPVDSKLCGAKDLTLDVKFDQHDPVWHAVDHDFEANGYFDVGFLAAATNKITIPALRWGAVNIDNSQLPDIVDHIDPFEFFEFRLNLTHLLGGSISCVSYVTFMSRESQSITADIADTTKPIEIDYCTQPPTRSPSSSPSTSPSKYPSHSPSFSPSRHPSVSPTKSPSTHPSSAPSNGPTRSPSTSPSKSPSSSPSTSPSKSPSHSPSHSPSNAPTLIPSASPSLPPTRTPTSAPTTCEQALVHAVNNCAETIGALTAEIAAKDAVINSRSVAAAAEFEDFFAAELAGKVLSADLNNFVSRGYNNLHFLGRVFASGNRLHSGVIDTRTLLDNVGISTRDDRTAIEEKVLQATQAIGYWLSNTVELEEYASVFEQHGFNTVDSLNLADITQTSLQSWNVNLAGHRDQILLAVQVEVNERISG